MPDLIDTLTTARRAARTEFGERTELRPGVTEVAITRSPSPDERLAIDAARTAVQDEANRLAANGDTAAAERLIRLAAEAEHAEHPQYADHWDDHRLAYAARRVRFKGGRAVERGDVLLARSDDPAREIVGTWSAYSARMGGDVGLRGGDLRPAA